MRGIAGIQELGVDTTMGYKDRILQVLASDYCRAVYIRRYKGARSAIASCFSFKSEAFCRRFGLSQIHMCIQQGHEIKNTLE